jgi:moderate conductance mechanosensitive channel
MPTDSVLDGPVTWQLVASAILPTLLVAWLGAPLARRLVTIALGLVLRDGVAPTSPAVRGLRRLVGAATFVLLAGVLVIPAMELAGLRPRAGVDLVRLADWAFGAGLRVILIIVLAYAVIRMTSLAVSRFEHELTQLTGLDALERAKRARTLGGLVTNVVTVAVSGIALLMVLQQFQVDVTPVLTGAGILGLAVGFGAQTLVRDVISGFFLILDNQVRVGDVAAINGQGGLVEAINLRTIVLRDQEGTVHVFPNGAIQTLANRSKEFSHYVVDLGVSYREDPDRVADVLRQIGAELQDDPRFGPSILAPLEVLGVDGFADSAVVIKFRIKTMPLKQWEVGRELRKRIKKRFDLEGIEIPFPQRVVTMRHETGTDAVGGGRQ